MTTPSVSRHELDQAPLDPGPIMAHVFGFAPPLIIETAIRHGVFDALDRVTDNRQGKDGTGLDLEALLDLTPCSRRGLKALMGGLVAIALVTIDDNQRYRLSPQASMFLVRGKPTYHGAFFLATSGRMLRGWRDLTDVVASGQPPQRIEDQDDGAAFFLQFVEDIFYIHYPAAARLAEALNVANWAEPISVLDLGAGSGVWSIAIAKAAPTATITAVDWQPVTQITQKVAAREGVGERLTTIAGDLHDVAFGTGHHIATIGHILHSEGEARSRAMLDKTFAALVPGGTVAIAEILVDDDHAGPPPALIFALNMLVHTADGGTFSFAEIAGWLGDAGFVDVRTVDAPGLAPKLILGTKPEVSRA